MSQVAPPAAPPTRSSEWRSSLALQGGPFDPSSNRYGQCGPIGTAQDAAVGVETAPLSGKGEIAKKHGTGPRNANAAGGVAGPAARGRHRQHGAINEAPTQLGDADLLRLI